MPVKPADALVRARARDDVIVEFAVILRRPAEIREGLTLRLDTLMRRRECRA